MAERDVLRGHVHELGLRALAFDLAHGREAERVEGGRVRVERVVVVRGVRRRNDECTLRDHHAVAERDVLQRLAGH